LTSLSRLVDVDRGSGALRRLQHRETWELVRPHWLLGLGPGRWQPAMMTRSIDLALNQNPQSDYLRVVSDCGFAGASAFIALYAFAFALGWRHRRAHPWAAAVVTAAALISVTDCALYRIEWCGALSVLLCFATEKQCSRSRRESFCRAMIR